MKMPIDGGSPELMKASVVPAGFMEGAENFSPDGRWMPEIADRGDPATQAVTIKVALVDVTANSETSIKYLDPRAEISSPIAFTPDGKALAVARYHVVSDVVLLRDTRMASQ